MIDQLSRAPIIIDLMAVALAFILPLLASSILLVKKRRYRAHKWLQCAIGASMGAMLLVFEYEMRTMGWREIAEDSPYYETYVMPALILHLIFAIPTFLLWVLVIFGARKNFEKSPKPSKYSMIHMRMGRLAFYLSFGTGFTAWLFYWLAFVA